MPQHASTTGVARARGGDGAGILGYHMTPALQATGHCPHCSKSVPNVALSSPSGYRMFLGPTWVPPLAPHWPQLALLLGQGGGGGGGTSTQISWGTVPWAAPPLALAWGLAPPRDSAPRGGLRRAIAVANCRCSAPLQPVLQESIGRGDGGNTLPLGHPAYAQPRPPWRQVPASIAVVTDSKRPQPL